jgi:hypothetical protein
MKTTDQRDYHRLALLLYRAKRESGDYAVLIQPHVATAAELVIWLWLLEGVEPHYWG